MWRTMFQPEYLLEPIPGPRGPFRILSLLLALGAVIGWLLALCFWRRRREHAATCSLTVETALAALSLALTGCALAATPYFSMRIVVFGSGLAALIYPIAAQIIRVERANLRLAHQGALSGQIEMGQVVLHSQRSAFRPAVWRPAELYASIDDALAQGTPVYLLEDGLDMASPLEAAGERYHLQFVGRYDIPFYHTGGGSTGGRIPLYCIEHPLGQRSGS